jgi:hypothetical protein
MEIEGFGNIIDMIYIVKRMYDLGRFELVKENFYDELSYDTYYENMYNVIENVFERYHCRCSEWRNTELHIISDPLFVSFYKLAGEYGKHHGIPDKKNRFIHDAEEKARDLFSFSYCLDFSLIGHTHPTRPFQSKLGLFISLDDYVDLTELAHGLIELYEWFTEQVTALKKLLADDILKEVMAA